MQGTSSGSFEAKWIPVDRGIDFINLFVVKQRNQPCARSDNHPTAYQRFPSHTHQARPTFATDRTAKELETTSLQQRAQLQVVGESDDVVARSGMPVQSRAAATQRLPQRRQRSHQSATKKPHSFSLVARMLPRILMLVNQ
jgi:hypothetical protein